MTTGAEIGLLRLLRGRTDESGVLNAGAPAAPAAPALPDLPERLAEATARLRSAVVSDDGGTVDYAALNGHAAYDAYRVATTALAGFDPRTLTTRTDRLAFWINLFNGLAIDAVVAFGLRGSIREAPGFFRRAAYLVGGERFSAEQIEHGILRGNRPALPRLPPPFGEEDPRLALCVRPPDPRVHFALNCATRSCPPLRAYTAGALDAQLDAAAAGFVRGAVALDGKRVQVSPIFLHYTEDFGGPEGAAGWICRYLDDEGEREQVRAAFQRGEVEYGVYDWGLNGPG